MFDKHVPLSDPPFDATLGSVAHDVCQWATEVITESHQRNLDSSMTVVAEEMREVETEDQLLHRRAQIQTAARFFDAAERAIEDEAIARGYCTAEQLGRNEGLELLRGLLDGGHEIGGDGLLS